MTITHLLLDIEGTTCPVSFVSEVLFPYARQSLSSFLTEHSNDIDLTHLLELAAHEWDADSSPDSINLRQGSKDAGLTPTNAIRMYFEHLIDIDRKSTALKDLQGRIWKDGYERGEIMSHLFNETAEV